MATRHGEVRLGAYEADGACGPATHGGLIDVPLADVERGQREGADVLRLGLVAALALSSSSLVPVPNDQDLNKQIRKHGVGKLGICLDAEKSHSSATVPSGKGKSQKLKAKAAARSKAIAAPNLIPVRKGGKSFLETK